MSLLLTSGGFKIHGARFISLDSFSKAAHALQLHPKIVPSIICKINILDDWVETLYGAIYMLFH